MEISSPTVPAGEDGKTIIHDAEGIPTSFTGMTIEDVLPKHQKPWYMIPHLRHLNFVLLAALVMPATNGFDGSMVNGLQTLPIWQQSKCTVA